MKKIFALAALAALGVATIGCEPKPAAPPADTKAEADKTMPAETPPAETPAPAPTEPAAPAEKAP